MLDFELLEYSPRAKAKLCRKRDTNRLYALKTFPNAVKKDSTERIVFDMIVGIRAPFLPQVHWSFQNEDDLHMVVVRPLSFFIIPPTFIGRGTGILSSGQPFRADRSPWRF